MTKRDESIKTPREDPCIMEQGEQHKKKIEKRETQIRKLQDDLVKLHNKLAKRETVYANVIE